MEEEKIDPINCSAVVRAVKQSGTFMLLDRDKEHYLVTETFILHLRQHDAFRIQCKLEVEKRNVYYERIKSNWVQSARDPDCDGVLEKYLSWIKQAEQGEILTPTGIAVVLYENTPMDGRLYAGADGYILVQGDYLNMIGSKLELVCIGDMVVVNGCNVLALMLDDAWQNNSFIVHKEGKQ